MSEFELPHPYENQTTAQHRRFTYFLLHQFPQVLSDVETVARLVLHHDEEAAHLLELFRLYPGFAEIDPERLMMPVELSLEESELLTQQHDEFMALQAHLKARMESEKKAKPRPTLNGRKGAPKLRHHQKLDKRK